MSDKKDLQTMIDENRKRFLEEYEANPDLYNPQDLEDIKKNDYYIRRFITYMNQGQEKGYENLVRSYRWRKEVDLINFDEYSIPKEVYQMGVVFNYFPDKDGCRTLYIQGKMHRKIDFVEPRIKALLAQIFYLFDKKGGTEHSWGIILDARETSYENADLGMLLYFFNTLKEHFPNSIRYIIIYGLPRILSFFASLVISMLPSYVSAKIRFYNEAQLHELIPVENLPDFLGGTCKRSYKRVPRNAKDVYELGAEQYGLRREQIDKLIKPSLKYIDTVNYEEVDKVLEII